MLEKKFEVYNTRVKSKPGISRHLEPITITDWYSDATAKTPLRKELDKARLVETLYLVVEGDDCVNGVDMENITYYEPKIHMEVRLQWEPTEHIDTEFVPIDPYLHDKESKLMFKRFPKAFAEFDAFRGFVNVNGQRGALSTNYLKEIGVLKSTPTYTPKGVVNERSNSSKTS